MKKKPKKKTSKYKSGLEEQVAKLLEGLGVSYEYESCKKITKEEECVDKCEWEGGTCHLKKD